MEYNTPLKISALAFIERVKANPEEFHEYVMTKPQRHKESVERMEKERAERRKKALNEYLSL
jgi:hypothetical protein